IIKHPFFFYLHHFSPECRGDRVLQTKGVETATEGGQLTLVCHYETDDPSPYLFWYKQGANDYPKYMLMRFKFGTGDNAADFKERFHADLDSNSKSVPLTIQRLQLSDSARYYCALKPTVTTGYTTPLQKHTELHIDNTPVCTVLNTSLKLTQSPLTSAGSLVFTSPKKQSWSKHTKTVGKSAQLAQRRLG
uniref:Ig-like domain-containing protein n=1 Tax=Oncorhynchus tshawytscha TaxID=74940 RepID=A0A8C8CYG7_ONCTS